LFYFFSYFFEKNFKTNDKFLLFNKSFQPSLSIMFSQVSEEPCIIQEFDRYRQLLFKQKELLTSKTLAALISSQPITCLPPPQTHLYSDIDAFFEFDTKFPRPLEEICALNTTLVESDTFNHVVNPIQWFQHQHCAIEKNCEDMLFARGYVCMSRAQPQEDILVERRQRTHFRTSIWKMGNHPFPQLQQFGNISLFISTGPHACKLDRIREQIKLSTTTHRIFVLDHPTAKIYSLLTQTPGHTEVFQKSLLRINPQKSFSFASTYDILDEAEIKEFLQIHWKIGLQNLPHLASCDSMAMWQGIVPGQIVRCKSRNEIGVGVHYRRCISMSPQEFFCEKVLHRVKQSSFDNRVSSLFHNLRSQLQKRKKVKKKEVKT
jgi:hypothetical protein